MSGLISSIDVLSSGMQAQSIRMATISSNLANIDSVSSSEGEAFRALLPEFKTVEVKGSQGAAGVVVSEIKESEAPAKAIFSPHHPLADDEGYIYMSNVSREEMIADMTSSSESYKANLSAIGLANTLIDETIRKISQ